MARWERVSVKDRPEKSIEQIPKDKIKKAVEIATIYRECSECGTEQWLNIVPGHNYSETCIECGESIVVVG